MRCLQCNRDLTNARAKYCSDKCRMKYKRTRPEQIDPNKTTRTRNPNTPGYITDAAGNKHPIDYESRRRTWNNLTPKMKALSAVYRDPRIDFNKYLGITA